jgi:hypothetical protein
VLNSATSEPIGSGSRSSSVIHFRTSEPIPKDRTFGTSALGEFKGEIYRYSYFQEQNI